MHAPNDTAPAAQAVLVLDEALIIRGAGDDVRRLLGYEPDELVGAPASRLAVDPAQTAWRCFGTMDALVRRRDDSRVLVELTLATLPENGTADLRRVAVLRDIGERRRAEAAIIEAYERLERMVEAITLLGVMLDSDGRITFCNDAFLELTGWKREQVLGHDWFETFILEDERDRVRRVFDEGLRRGHIRSPYENHIITRDGTRRLIHWNNAVLTDGSVDGVAGFGIDVTDQRGNEANLRRHSRELQRIISERTRQLRDTRQRLRHTDRLAAVGTLASGLGHDMGNAILPMRCRLDAAEAAASPEAAAEHLAQVRRSLSYLEHLADGLRLLGAEPGRAGTGTSMSLAEWWEQAGPLLAQALPQGATFNVSLPADLPHVATDAHRLAHIVLNLLENASEAIGKAGRVSLWARQAGDGVAIGVTDDGCGMTEEVRRRACDPYFSTRPRALGTGLGLSLVRSMVSQAGGTLDIESEPGRGTTVVITMPVAKDHPVAPTEQRLTAVVRVSDPRTRALISMLLAAHDVGIRADGSSDLYVAESAGSPAAKDEKLLARAGRVVLLGRPRSGSVPDEAVVIERADDFDQIRAGIERAIQGLPEVHA